MLWHIVKDRYKKHERTAPLRDEEIWDESKGSMDLGYYESMELWKGVFTSLYRSNEKLFWELDSKKKKNWTKAIAEIEKPPAWLDAAETAAKFRTPFPVSSATEYKPPTREFNLAEYLAVPGSSSSGSGQPPSGRPASRGSGQRLDEYLNRNG